MKNILFLIIFFQVTIFASKLTYEDVIKHTIAHSTILKQKDIETKIEEANLELLKSKLYPQLSVIYNVEDYESLDKERQNISVGNNLVNSSVKYKNSMGISLNYDLYDFGAKDEQIKAQKKEISIKGLDSCSQEIKIKEEVLKYYTDVINAQYDLNSFQEITSLLKKMYEYKKRLFISGMISSVDVYNEMLRVRDYENKTNEAKKEYLIALTFLKHISYNLVNPTQTQLTPLIPKEDKLDKTISYEDSYLAEQYRLKKEQKQHEKKSFIKSNLPSVSLNSNYYFYGSDQDSFKSSTEAVKKNSYNVGVSVRAVLFEGFKYNNQMDKFELEKRLIELENQVSKENFEKEIDLSQKNIEQLNILVSGNNKSLEETKEILDTKTKLKDNGELDIISQLQGLVDLYEKDLAFKHKQTSLAMEQKLINIRNKRCK